MKDVSSGFRSRHTLSGLLPWQSYFLAFVLGIFFYKYPVPASAGLGVLILVDSVYRGWKRKLPVLFLVLCGVFGFAYASQRAVLPAAPLGWMELRQVVPIRGVVDRVEPLAGHRVRLILKDIIAVVDGTDQALPGKMVWNWRSPTYDPVPGQHVESRLRVVPVRSFGNPGSWDYQWYWLRQGIQWRAWPKGRNWFAKWGKRPDNALWNLKSAIRRSVAAHIPSTQGGAMVLALTTGDRFLLGSHTIDSVRAAGLAHTLALSGLHIGFVAALGCGIAWIICWMFPSLMLVLPRQKLAVLCAAPLVFGYAWIGQPSPSLVRAAIMFGFWGIFLLQGRSRVLLDGLFFAVVAIVLFDPLSIFDLSLQMSALAVLGIGVMYPLYSTLFRSERRWWHRVARWCGGLLALSVCANVALLPLISTYFGTWTPNVLLNVLWLPLLGAIVMPLGLVGALLVVCPWGESLGSLLLSSAAQVVEWMLRTLDMIHVAGWTPVFAVLRPLWPELLGVGLLLVIAVSVVHGARVRVGLAALGLVLMISPHCTVMVSDTLDEVRLDVLDVGLGQAVVITLPGGHRWLVDGGGGSRTFDLGEAVVGPYLTQGRPPRLDGVFMSHPDADHSHGLSYILSRFDVGAFYYNGAYPRGRNGQKFREALLKSGLHPRVVYAGETIPLNRDMALEILHPAESFKERHANERSLLIRGIRHGRGLFLLPGDLEMRGIKAALATESDMQSEVLVMPHHGSKTSVSSRFYHAVNAQIALCSNGYLNRYGFPHAQAVSEVGVPVLTTSRHGLLQAVWNAQNVLTMHVYLP